MVKDLGAGLRGTRVLTRTYINDEDDGVWCVDGELTQDAAVLVVFGG